MTVQTEDAKGSAEEAESRDRARAWDTDLEGRVVVITGAGQGIGREYARQFSAAGASVVVAELNAESGQRVVAEIDEGGDKAISIVTDVSDPDSVDEMAARAIGEFGRIDCLINNAAIFSTLEMRPFDQIPLAEWDAVMRVNLTGSFLAARAVVGSMRENSWGRIVNVMSGAVVLGVPNYLHYVASKSAMVGMTASMARELGGEGITVNAVQPGGTFTEVERKTMTEEGIARLLSSQCIQRREVPADLVGLVLFLSTEAAAFITGQTIAVDGGLTHR